MTLAGLPGAAARDALKGTKTTGYMPFYLNYGFYPCTPMDLIHDSDSTMIEVVNQFVERMKRNFSTAVKFLNWAQDRMKAQVDQKR